MDNDLHHLHLMLKSHISHERRMLELELTGEFDRIRSALSEIPVAVNNDVVRITDSMSEDFEQLIDQSTESISARLDLVLEALLGIATKQVDLEKKVADIQAHLDLHG